VLAVEDAGEDEAAEPGQLATASTARAVGLNVSARTGGSIRTSGFAPF
jgi:hypothetical protein